MKIIITYVSVGGGHQKAADAIYSHFKSSLLDFDVQIVDVLEKSHPFFKFLYNFGYVFLVNHALFLWAFGFWLTSKKSVYGFVQTFNVLINRLNTKKLEALLIRQNPDFVISTHFMPSELTAYLKNKGKIDSKLITVITDFGVHPFWISKGTDIYIVASELTKEKLQDWAGPGLNIKVCGIPVDQMFFKKYDKAEIRSRLGLAEGKFTVLVVTGSFGIGPIEKITKILHEDVQLLVVCARNCGLFARMKKKRYPGLRLYGFVNNIHEMMQVSDCIITKPGGLIVSELLVLQLVPIFVCAIPGQETENAKTLAGYGVGVSCKEPEIVRQIVLDYKKHPEKIARIKESIKKISKPDAVEELYDVVRQSSPGSAHRRTV